MVIRVRRRHICSLRAACHRYRYQLSLTLQGVCGNYILSILPSKRGILFIGLWHPIGGCGWCGGLGRDACIPGTSIYAIHQMLKEHLEPNEIFLF